jgi:hypothetical protein
MKSFKQFVEEKEHIKIKEVSPLQGLVATMPEDIMVGSKIDINLIDKAIKKGV